ncbi:hypothetical protein [Paludisphaera rhizosphaerae]|uniref:hypothetical protein n=1 Tax=Paludisphaera rhizosphaerae TaxID=2711216 RepID=UPI0013EC2EC9|nr:hypothetical protein [Paludisphaera rhizosphaerae]
MWFFGFIALAWPFAVCGYLLHETYSVPRLLDRWAATRGLRVVEWRRADAFDVWTLKAVTRGYSIHPILVEDHEGRLHRAVARVALSNRPAGFDRVDVHWDAPVAHPLKEGTLAESGFVSERMIRGFAVADLVLALPALALGLVSLLILALGADEASGGAWGLNRLVGRTANTYPGDLPRVMWMCLGFGSLYLTMAGAMIAGSVGMLLRRRWGYTCHIVGSGLFALTMFGIVYTAISLTYGLRPEFKMYFERPKGRVEDPDFMGDAWPPPSSLV